MRGAGRPKPARTVALAVLIASTLVASGVYLVGATGARGRTPATGSEGPARAMDLAPEPAKIPPVPPAQRLPDRDLRPGDRGPAVRLLQHLLADLHYDVGTIDGRFGFDTAHAVVAFQKVNGLHRDGVVDAKTREAFESPVVPRPRHPKRRGISIEVDLTKQVLYVLRDGELHRILDTSTGGGYTFYSRGVRKVAVTVTGDYEIYLQYDGWYESSVGPMYRSSFYLRGFAIHGATEVPPYPASHGCARVTLSAIDRLWPDLKVGTKVSVYRS